MKFEEAMLELENTVKKLESGETTLEELSAYACSLGKCADPGSGKQEYIQSAINGIMFGE